MPFHFDHLFENLNLYLSVRRDHLIEDTIA